MQYDDDDDSSDDDKQDCNRERFDTEVYEESDRPDDLAKAQIAATAKTVEEEAISAISLASSLALTLHHNAIVRLQGVCRHPKTHIEHRGRLRKIIHCTSCGKELYGRN